MKRVSVSTKSHSNFSDGFLKFRFSAVFAVFLLLSKLSSDASVLSVDFSDGLLSSWNTVSSTATVSSTVANSSPVGDIPGNGNYLYLSVTGTSSGTGTGGAYYQHNTSGSSIYTYNFDIRIDSLPWSSTYFYISSGASANANTSLSNYTWCLIGTKSAGWSFIDGNGDGTYSTVASGMSVATGTTYHVTVNVDVAAQTWTSTISNGSTSVSSDILSFRYASASEGSYLQFGANDNSTTTTDYSAISIDNLSIASIPEPSIALLFFSGILLSSACFLKKKLSRGIQSQTK